MDISKSFRTTWCSVLRDLSPMKSYNASALVGDFENCIRQNHKNCICKISPKEWCVDVRVCICIYMNERRIIADRKCYGFTQETREQRVRWLYAVNVCIFL